MNTIFGFAIDGEIFFTKVPTQKLVGMEKTRSVLMPQLGYIITLSKSKSIEERNTT
jgi:hypothetical protein